MSVGRRLVSPIAHLLATSRSAQRIARLFARLVDGRTCVVLSGPAKGLRIVTRSRLGYIVGTSERLTQDFLVAHLAAGDVFYDLGANVGFFSLLACRLVGPTGAVIAIEPLPQNAAVARHNARVNAFDQMTVLQCAVGAANRQAAFRVGGSDQSGRIEEGGDVTVAVRSVDSLVRAGLPPPTFVKIDVEGGEFAALEGMRETLHAHAPVLLCEMHTNNPSLGADSIAAAMLTSAGYSLRWLEAVDGAFWAPHLIALPKVGPKPCSST